MAIVKKTNQVAAVGIGDLGTYVAGGGLPEGKYALEFDVQMYQAKKQDGSTAGPSRLGVMVTAHSLTDPSAEPRTQFYSMGTKAHESFAPNPDTGKGVVQVAGGSGASGLSMNTNWYFLLKSLYDCGLPQGVFTNDFTVLDGVHVMMHNIPEPEERKSFAQSKTSEVADEPRKSGTIAVVGEILEDGEPWNGGGGIPDKTAAPVAKPAGKTAVAAKAAAKPVVAAKAAAKPAPVQAAASGGLTEDELQGLAIDAISGVIEKNPDGCPKLVMKTGVFKAVASSADDDTASAVIDTFFKDDEVFTALIEQLGYTLQGHKIVLMA